MENISAAATFLAGQVVLVAASVFGTGPTDMGYYWMLLLQVVGLMLIGAGVLIYENRRLLRPSQGNDQSQSPSDMPITA